MYIFVCLINLSSLDLSEVFLSGVSSMYFYFIHYLNFFLSYLIKKLTLASLSRLSTIRSDVNFSVTSFNFHGGL